jgi:hypothetical protein
MDRQAKNLHALLEKHQRMGLKNRAPKLLSQRRLIGRITELTSSAANTQLFGLGRLLEQPKHPRLF